MTRRNTRFRPVLQPCKDAKPDARCPDGTMLPPSTHAQPPRDSHLASPRGIAVSGDLTGSPSKAARGRHGGGVTGARRGGGRRSSTGLRIHSIEILRSGSSYSSLVYEGGDFTKWPRRQSEVTGGQPLGGDGRPITSPAMADGFAAHGDH